MRPSFIFLSGLLLSSPAILSEASEKTNHTSYHEGMVLISAGTFQMGSELNQGYKTCMETNTICKKKWFSDEQPVHKLKLKTFHIDIYEITQQEFEGVMKENPSEYEGLNRPVENVTWFEAANYCERLGKRLPTEAEWERAARGKTDSVFWWGNKADSGKANFCDVHCEKPWKVNQLDDGFSFTAPVGSLAPNNYGLFDMAGNVYEWVDDWYDEDYYRYSPEENPLGPKKGKKKIMRGGSWINYPTGVRSADRTDSKPNARMGFVGFRCAI
jgi:formylglycine-generating enzyme required for sulfatase activity